MECGRACAPRPKSNVVPGTILLVACPTPTTHIPSKAPEPRPITIKNIDIPADRRITGYPWCLMLSSHLSESRNQYHDERHSDIREETPKGKHSIDMRRTGSRRMQFLWLPLSPLGSRIDTPTATEKTIRTIRKRSSAHFLRKK